MIRRTFDRDAINALANDPSIRPHIGGDPNTPVDLGPAINDQNVFLLGDHGLLTFSWSAPRAFEFHIMIRPSGRGQWASRATRRALVFMAARHGATLFWCRILPADKRVRAFARHIGAVPAGIKQFDLGTGPTDYLIYERRT